MEIIRIARRLGMKEKELYDAFLINEDKLKTLMTD